MLLNFSEQLNLVERKVLMVIFPHPDDETFATGSLLLEAKRAGWKTIVVTLTKGGAGKIFVHGRGRSVIEIREQELKNAAKILNVDELIVGNFSDAKLIKEEKEWLPWVEALIKKYNPGIIATYDYSGFSGHPDHIIISTKLFNVVKKLKNKPELFWSTIPLGHTKGIVSRKVMDYLSEPTHFLPVTIFDKITKFRAFMQYKSQFPLSIYPLIAGFIFKSSSEWYHKVDLDKNYKYKFVDFKF